MNMNAIITTTITIANITKLVINKTKLQRQIAKGFLALKKFPPCINFHP